MSWFLLDRNLKLLEPYDWKLSRTVLRGERGSNAPDLPGKKAVSEVHLQIEEATRRIREEKEKAIREVRSEIADLSIAIAEKVMKEKIGRDKEQQQMIDRLLDEVSFSKS